nr:MAG TPA: hypothetical protein [Caudoviricetes sp.]DAY94974.1 MAG TPA: hypothetical protein [Caudoviricetes sp.]
MKSKKRLHSNDSKQTPTPCQTETLGKKAH